ncbi:unnamed protein product [Trichobilharzia szidati]|nr:unnamed protein product [Trichobilharzia szidati]
MKSFIFILLEIILCVPCHSVIRIESRVEYSSYGDPKLNISDYDEEDDRFAEEFGNFEITKPYNPMKNNMISSAVNGTNARNNSRDSRYSGFSDFLKSIEKRAQEDDYDNNRGDEKWSSSEESMDRKSDKDADDDFFKSGPFDSDDDQSDDDLDFSDSKAGGHTSDKESNMNSGEKTSKSSVITSVQLHETPNMYNNKRYDKKQKSTAVKRNKWNAEQRRNRHRKKRRHRDEFFSSEFFSSY